MTKLDLLTKQIDEFSQDLIDNYYMTKDYTKNFMHLPTEEDYVQAEYYGPFWNANNDVTSLQMLSTLCTQYKYDAVEDLLHDLYTHCKIETKIKVGSYCLYAPSYCISFGTYTLWDEEVALPPNIIDKLEALSAEDYRYMENTVKEALSIRCIEPICLYLNIKIAFELTLDNALHYLTQKGTK